MDLYTTLTQLPHTSLRTISQLKTMGISTFFDLLQYFPTRHNDYCHKITIAKLTSGNRNNQTSLGLSDEPDSDLSSKLTISGVIQSVTTRVTRRGLRLLIVTLGDNTGTTELVWFNQPYLLTVIKKGFPIQVSGHQSTGGLRGLIPEEYEIISDAGKEPIHTGRLVPVYPQKFGLSSKTVREKIFYLLQTIDESQLLTLQAPEIEKQYGLMPAAIAYKQIHFPQSRAQFLKARERLAFDELFLAQLSSRLVREQWEREIVTQPLKVKKYQLEIDKFTNKLPFELTKAQKRATKEILDDLESQVPMNRLLQGDVGSGKTVVAALAALVCFLNGKQTLIMAPTEILARQHHKTLTMVFQNFSTKKPTVILHTSAEKAPKNALQQADIIIGTHALITKKADFAACGLVIIDEQHKFGVAQRAALKQKGASPHLLSMTATPIPRTVSLTLYGELDISIIDELPKGRKITKTFLVPPQKRIDAEEWIGTKIKKEQTQVFVVCPLIDQSLVETMQTIKAASVELERLKKVFSQFRLAMLHGRMRTDEKIAVMKDFLAGKIDILVSTPVVEVGVDVPNANIIVIEGAERFGLAQLHQLRGRVGRSEKQAHCLLFTEKNIPAIKSRLQTFSRINSGFALAEYDLKHRGVGEMYGTKQHGLSEFKLASLTDSRLVAQTSQAANEFIKNYSLTDFPALAQQIATYQTHNIAHD